MTQHSLVFLFVSFFAHWAGDYTKLSTPWMLAAKKFGSPIFPIFCHAMVHAVLTLIVVFAFTSFWVSIKAFCIMLFTHWVVDIMKGKLNVFFPSLQNPANPYHWYVFGADQLLHAWVIISIVYSSLQ